MQLFTNNGDSKLFSDITDTDTQITLDSGDGVKFSLNSAQSGDFELFTLENSSGVEIVKATLISGDVLTVVRGQEGTTAQAFKSQDVIGSRFTKGSINLIQNDIIANKSTNATQQIQITQVTNKANSSVSSINSNSLQINFINNNLSNSRRHRKNFSSFVYNQNPSLTWDCSIDRDDLFIDLNGFSATKTLLIKASLNPNNSEQIKKKIIIFMGNDGSGGNVSLNIALDSSMSIFNLVYSDNINNINQQGGTINITAKDKISILDVFLASFPGFIINGKSRIVSINVSAVQQSLFT